MAFPRGGKTSLTGTWASRGWGEKALSPRSQPLVQASGEGRGSATPKCYILYAWKDQFCPPVQGLSVYWIRLRGRGLAGHLVGEGELFLPLPRPWAIWASFGALCQASAHATWAWRGPDAGQRGRIMSRCLPWFPGSLLPFQPANVPPTRILKGNSPLRDKDSRTWHFFSFNSHLSDLWIPSDLYRTLIDLTLARSYPGPDSVFLRIRCGSGASALSAVSLNTYYAPKDGTRPWGDIPALREGPVCLQAWSNLLPHLPPPSVDASNCSSSVDTTSSGRSTQPGSISPQHTHRPLGHPITCHSSDSPARRGASVLHGAPGPSRASKCLLIIRWKRRRNGRSPFYHATNNDEFLSMYLPGTFYYQTKRIRPPSTNRTKH